MLGEPGGGLCAPEWMTLHPRVTLGSVVGPTMLTFLSQLALLFRPCSRSWVLAQPWEGLHHSFILHGTQRAQLPLFRCALDLGGVCHEQVECAPHAGCRGWSPPRCPGLHPGWDRRGGWIGDATWVDLQVAVVEDTLCPFPIEAEHSERSSLAWGAVCKPLGLCLPDSSSIEG